MMKTYSKYERYRHSLVRFFCLTTIVMIAAANGFDSRGARAAMRLPEDVISLEPSLAPANARSVAVESAPVHEMPAAPDAPRRSATAALRASADHQRPQQSTNYKDKRELAELMGLIREMERGYLLPFENFQSCRQFVALNC
jgi:hypothetical protein